MWLLHDACNCLETDLPSFSHHQRVEPKWPPQNKTDGYQIGLYRLHHMHWKEKERVGANLEKDKKKTKMDVFANSSVVPFEKRVFIICRFSWAPSMWVGLKWDNLPHLDEKEKKKNRDKGKEKTPWLAKLNVQRCQKRLRKIRNKEVSLKERKNKGKEQANTRMKEKKARPHNPSRPLCET